jgi:hypothetical protein
MLTAVMLLALASPAASPPTHPIDAHTVQRDGTGYRYRQAGWIVLHIEGKPYERGVQHGKLLAPEIAAHLRCYSSTLSPRAPSEGWRMARTLTNALFLRGFLPEYLEEMKGIADGASAAGARFDGRRVDVTDIATLNAWPEIETLDSALRATATGLEGTRLGLPNPRPKPDPKPMHCSAFAATGPATRDGKIVFGHITMFSLYPANFYNVWLDIKPEKGHRVLMQSFPGGIHSGMDYYMNDAGLLINETTIGQTPFDRNATPLSSRIRQAIQYSDSIDKAAAILLKDNNGLYTNEWLMGDIKTDEIAMLELGTKKHRLRRSSKGEWFGDTKGFYWGCNNTKDFEVRLETIASTSARPSSALFAPSARDKKWVELYDKHQGKMDDSFGRLAFTTPPLAAFSSVDAKLTTSAMAERLETWALFGPPMGRTWGPTFEERKKYAEIRPLVSNPWTVLTGKAPVVEKETPKVADLHDPAGKKLPEAVEAFKPTETTSAWRGTLRPKAGADAWLAAAWPAYERIVALENALIAGHDDGKLTAGDRERLAVELFAYQSEYDLAVAASKDVPLDKIESSARDDAWHRIARGKGVLFLHALRGKLGAKAFDERLDAFGTANAGKEVTTTAFRAHLGKGADDLFGLWYTKPGLPERAGGAFSVLSFYAEVESAVIVYGTLDEEKANFDAAKKLQAALLRRGFNVEVPIKRDSDMNPTDFAGRHLLLVGRPATNAVARDWAKQFPVAFGPASVVVKGKTYAHADTGVLVAGTNKLDKRYSAVLVAGLSAEATVATASKFRDRGLAAGEVVLFARGGAARAMVVPSSGSAQK